MNLAGQGPKAFYFHCRMSRMTFTSAPGGGSKKAAEVDWNEVDIDELVERLTPGEIEKLLEEFDPDDPHLPPSERCAYKCDKLPTGKLRLNFLYPFW